jgi:hypothetical protein
MFISNNLHRYVILILRARRSVVGSGTILINFFNLRSGGWKQGPLDTAAT